MEHAYLQKIKLNDLNNRMYGQRQALTISDATVEKAKILFNQAVEEQELAQSIYNKSQTVEDSVTLWEFQNQYKAAKIRLDRLLLANKKRHADYQALDDELQSIKTDC